MPQASKRVYIVDLIIQSLFLPAMLLCYFASVSNENTFFAGLLIQLFVGMSQLLSGLFHTLRYQDKLRMCYLVSAIAYLIFLGIVVPFLDSPVKHNNYPQPLSFVFIVIPSCIAIWYYVQTILAIDGRKIKLEKPKAINEDLLDADL